MSATAAPAGVVLPGQRLGSTRTARPGPGTFVWGHHVYASVVGAATNDLSQEPSTLSIAHRQHAVLPVVGDTVTCRVLRINPRLANVEILCVGGVALRESCSGIIRREDIRDFDIDKLEMHKCFRPTDVLQARVISLGDSRSYFLTTAASELGVVFAHSAEGAIMEPVSWQEMTCPVTHAREARKVAKPPDPDAGR